MFCWGMKLDSDDYNWANLNNNTESIKHHVIIYKQTDQRSHKQ